MKIFFYIIIFIIFFQGESQCEDLRRYIRVLHSRFFDKYTPKAMDNLKYNVNLYVDGKKTTYKFRSRLKSVVAIEFISKKKISNIQFVYAFYRINENIIIFYKKDLEKLKKLSKKKRKLLYLKGLYGSRPSHFKIRNFPNKKIYDPLDIYIAGERLILTKFYYEINPKLLIKHLEKISEEKREKRIKKILCHFHDKKVLGESLSLCDIKKISSLISDKKIITDLLLLKKSKAKKCSTPKIK